MASDKTCHLAAQLKDDIRQVINAPETDTVTTTIPEKSECHKALSLLSPISTKFNQEYQKHVSTQKI
jgi:hypothetical protein